eukprot:223702-Prorocentrum_minimum.AAC.1
MRKYGYKRTVLDMWKSPEEPHGLDPKASTSIFGKGVGSEVSRIHRTIRAQFLDLAGETTCPLCGGSPDNWAHMLLSCRHEDVKEYYMARHDAAGRKLVSGLRNGTMGQWLIRANFGKVDGNPEDTT